MEGMGYGPARVRVGVRVRVMMGVGPFCMQGDGLRYCCYRFAFLIRISMLLYTYVSEWVGVRVDIGGGSGARVSAC